MKTKKIATRTLAYLALLVVFLIIIYPVVWMIAGSLKTEQEFYQNVWGLPSQFQWDNYSRAWNHAKLGQKYVNSLLVTGGFLCILLPVVCCAAYAIARVQFKGKNWFFRYLLMGVMIPGGVLAIPSFALAVKLSLVDTRTGLTLFCVAHSIAFGVFLMRSFFISLPKSLEEAAMIDGCTRFGSFLRVILPLSVPGLMTQVIYSGLNVWNNYLMANLLIRSPEKQTLPLGLAIFTAENNVKYPVLFAALVCVTVPMLLVYIAGQKTFIAGMTAGAVKG